MTECSVTYTIQTIVGILMLVPFFALGFGGLYIIKRMADVEMRKLAPTKTKSPSKESED